MHLLQVDLAAVKSEYGLLAMLCLPLQHCGYLELVAAATTR